MNIINMLTNGGRTLVQSILPARCPVTGDMVAAPGLISARVYGNLNFITAPFCACCGIPFDVPGAEATDLCPACLAKPPHFNAARSVVVYDDQSRDMILAFKHGDQTHLAASFGLWLTRLAKEFSDQIDLVIPVPLHPRRLWARRYNQAGILADRVARALDRPFKPHLLRRVKATASMGHMTKTERAKNIAGAFRVPPALRATLKGQRVLLVDDVFTTGSTVNAAARALKRAGATHVMVITLARVHRPWMVEPADRRDTSPEHDDEGL